MSRPRILIVDDEQHIVHLLAMSLRRAGYEVLTADNGVKGIQLADAFKLDLMIVDQTMPGMTGTELAKKVGGLYPIIMLTGMPEMNDAGDAGIFEVIHKPFSPKELVGRVQSLIGPGNPPKEHCA